MGIIASANKSFVPCPAGVQQAVCCDVHDLGMVETTYQNQTKIQHKIDVYWQSAENKTDEGRPCLIRKRYTLSLDPKANLNKDLQSWRGKPFTADELKGFDVEKLIGANALLNVQHVERNGETYANITAIMPITRGMTKVAVEAEYIRKKDRAPQHEAGSGASDEMNADDIPF